MLSPNACCRVRSAWCVGCDFHRPHGCCSSAMLTNIAANTMAPVMRVRSRTHLCFATMACPNLECMRRNTLSSVHVRCARCKRVSCVGCRSPQTRRLLQPKSSATVNVDMRTVSATVWRRLDMYSCMRGTRRCCLRVALQCGARGGGVGEHTESHRCVCNVVMYAPQHQWGALWL